MFHLINSNGGKDGGGEVGNMNNPKKDEMMPPSMLLPR